MNSRMLAALTLCIFVGSAAAQSGEYWTGPLDIQFAVVRAPGNEADQISRFRQTGRVDYVYSISSHEVTNAEYAAFLNSVSAKGDPYGLWHHSNKGDL